MQTTEWLNYHHLYYFWVIAKEGSLSRASERMKLTRSTLSAQIHALEECLGGELFLRSGRAMSLTALGIDVMSYADDIFRCGAELIEMTREKKSPRRAVLRVGVVASIPKTIAYRLIEPAFNVAGRGPLSLRQDSFDRLLDELLAGHLHLLISDVLPAQGSTASVYAQVLCETSVCIHGVPQLASQYRANFPDSLNDAPFLLPAQGTRLRSLLEDWFMEHDIRVRVEGEFDDDALMRAFGVEGRGLFPTSAELAAEVEQASGALQLGLLGGVSERFYAISTERRMSRAETSAIVQRGQSRRLEPLRLKSAAAQRS